MPDVTTINLDDCFVCESTGYMLSLGTPSKVYYGGPTPEGRAAAKAAAETEAAKRKAEFPSLNFIVKDLTDYLYDKADSDREEGARDADPGF